MDGRIVCHDRDKQFTLECHWLKPADILRNQGWYRLRLMTALQCAITADIRIPKIQNSFSSI